MALIGVNDPGQYRGNTGTLDRIAKGVDIATKILGTGLNTYKTIASDIPLQKAQAAYYTSETANKTAMTNLEFAKMGYMPVDTDHVHVPDLSTGPGAASLSHQGTTIQTNSAVPNAMKVGNQTYLQVANPMALQPLQQKQLEGELQNGEWALTSDHDPSEDKVAFYIPNAPFAFWKKPVPLGKEKAATIEDKMATDFKNDDNVTRATQVIQSGRVAKTIQDKMQNNQPVYNSDDIALTQSFMNSLTKSARMQGENIGNVQDMAESLIPGIGQKLKAMMSTPANEISKLDPTTRGQIISSIGSIYNSVRPLYDQAYDAYAKTAQARGLNAIVPKLDPIDFGGGARTQGMQQERQKSAGQFQTQFPAAHPSPAPNVLDSLGKKLGIH